jgi:glycosyltransferase involved in cell wall biosynthesis
MATAAARNQMVNAQFRTELAWFAQVAVAASPFTADELHRHTGYPPERIRVVPLRIDPAQFGRKPAASDLAHLRRRWNLDGKRVLLYIGRLAGNKRIDLLIDALAQLAPRYPDLHLLLVGSTAGDAATAHLHAQLRQRATARGIAARVTFTGKVERVDDYLHLAAMVLLASQHEGFGVPVVEAMAAGVPVVASASGALPWVMDAGDGEPAGLLFPPGDVGALADAIEQLLTQPALAAALVARGRSVMERYTPARFRQRVLDVLEEVSDLARLGPAPAAQRSVPALYEQADIALRAYQVRSRLPLVGRLVDWVRVNATSHLKEAYLDGIVEQQVNYNRLAAQELAAIRREVNRLQAQTGALAAANPARKTPD